MNTLNHNCNVGIDVSKDDFKAAILLRIQANEYKKLGSNSFTNNEELSFTMEFTGRYSDGISYFLHNKKYQVFMVSPFKSKKFRDSYDADIKNDVTDAHSLAISLTIRGLERKLKLWEPDSDFFSEIKVLTRERSSLIKQMTTLKNRIKSLKFAETNTDSTIKRHTELLDFIKEQIEAIDEEIAERFESKPDISEKVENLETIKGIGKVTIAIVLAETDGFRKIPNAKALTAFAGYKITQNQSGTFDGPGHISKRGDKFLRHALHMPILSVIQCNPLFKEKYQKLKERKAKPIIATTAIERKVLTLMYSMYKNNTKFDVNYASKN